MICFCACTKISQSPLENPKSRDSCKFCKSCGGRLSIDGPGAQSVSMLSTIGLERPRLIDPQLTWKTASNGRQRAVRRARTSFTCANIMKAPARSLKVSEDNGAKSTGDMTVSESEKVGVSILGRRFSESLGSVPIKKRRFLLVQSPSPPHHSTSYSDGVNSFLEDQRASHQDTEVNQECLHDIKTSYRGKISADGKTDQKELNEKSCDDVDFSGISILAAAACDSNIGGGSVISEASVFKEHYFGGKYIARRSSQLHFLTEEKGVLLTRSSEGSVGRTKVSILSAAACDSNMVGNSVISEASFLKEHSFGGQNIALRSSQLHFLTEEKEELLPRRIEGSDGRDGRTKVSSSLELPSKESNDVKSDASCNLRMPMNSSRKDANKTTESASHDVRFPWDLNTVMNVWESHDDEVLNSEPQCTNIGVKTSHSENYGNIETCEGQVGFQDNKNNSGAGDCKVHLAGNICEFEKVRMEGTSSISGDHSTTGDGESKTCFPIPHEDAPASDGRHSEVLISKAYVSEETKPSYNANRNCTVSADFHASVGGALVSVGDSSLSSSAMLEVENAEQHCKSFISEVEIENSSSCLLSCNISIQQNTSAFEPHYGLNQGVIEATLIEDKNVASVAEQENHCDNCCMTDVQMTIVTDTSIQGEKEPLCIDSETIRTSSHSLGSHLSERIPDVLVDGNICGTVVTAGASCGENVEIENSSSCLLSCNISIQQNTSAFEPHYGLNQGVIEATLVEDKNVASVAEQENHCDNCCMTDVQMTIVTDTSIQGEKEPLCIDSETIRISPHSLGSHLCERIPDALVDGNICGTTAGASCGENVHTSVVNGTNSADTDKMGGEIIICDAECEKTDAEVMVNTTVAEMEFDMRNAEKKVDATDVEIDGVICNELTSENFDGTKNEFPDQVLHNKSTIMPLGKANAPLEDGSLGSQRILRNNVDGSAINSGQLALEDQLDCDYYSDASQNDTDQTTEMEKVEFLADDDSQYEDGEFRQPIADCWLEDGADDGEVECVDCGSNRETDMYEAAADFSASVNPQVSNGGMSDASVRIPYGAHVGKGTQHPVSPSILNCPLIADSLDSASGKKNVGSVAEKGSRVHNRTEDGSKQMVNDVQEASKFYASSYKVTGNNRFHNGGHGNQNLSHTRSSRIKMSGWDQLPGGRIFSENGPPDPRVAPISPNHTGASLDTFGSSESVRRVVGPSMRRDLSFRMERAQRKDKSYIRTSRSNDHDFNSQAEADVGAPCSIGKSGSSLHLLGRGRGEPWADSLKHHGNNRHDSSGYHGHASFSHPGSRNAAAAAVAKVESNGFVVAPDGTIVKANAVGSSGPRARESGKASSQSNHQPPLGRGSLIERDRPHGMPPVRGCSRGMSAEMSMPVGRVCGRSRGMSPDMSMLIGRARAGRYGTGMVKLSCRERYRTPISDDIIDSPLPVSRRDRSFSPRTRPFHLVRSHSRSPSRSRTRSPPRWASPRLRNVGRMNNGPAGFRRNSKSPNFNSEATMVRPRPIFWEHITSSRNHPSPPHSSRWIDGRKELPEHFRVHEYRRCSPRVFSRGQKYELMDSPGRPKQSEFYQPINSGNFANFSFDRGSRHEGRDDDRRGHADRYEMHHSVRQYNDGNMKRFHSNDENGFRTHNPQPKSSDFPRGETPRAFDRNVEGQLGDSPLRFKEENGQCEGNRDGKNNSSFKSFGVAEDDDHMDAQKRRPS
ncbi:uncharacterized protein M6B38_267940 [Iris pallida]|uniref:Uncharacterized protein n=1 Tax=Iris pallida TaxID=29817 RepID=A0AAX6I9A9_IRIPA|nr:uncharacterized protein M6B38_267940 [Iris pallida]